MEKCLACESEFRNLRSLIKHANYTHNLSTKEYYDKYLKSDTEGLCKMCQNPTVFRGSKTGYLTYCSTKCRNLDPSFGKKISKGKKGKKQTKEHIAKRIQSIDQHKKEATRRQTMLDRYGEMVPLEIREKIGQGNCGKKRPRKRNHQRNIIESKRKNGTLRHSDATKKKMRKAILSSQKWKSAMEKFDFSQVKTGGKHLTGKFKGVHFRSSYELAFLIECHLKSVVVQTAETKEFQIAYVNSGKNRYYYPDFFLPQKDLVVEIKPKSRIQTESNILKFSAAKLQFHERFVVITEDELENLKDWKVLINDENISPLLEVYSNEHLCSG